MSKASSRLFALTLLVTLSVAGAIMAQSQPSLRPVSEFDRFTDESARSRALFLEASRVITHPRCMNCHPSSRRPTQGDQMTPHVPAVYGGSEGHGVPGAPCSACHQPANTPTTGETIQSVPGDPHWALAPASMAWQGRSLRQICQQLKDPRQNGGRTLDQLRHHMAEDHLVGWAWRPGAGRTPAPGDQTQFGQLIAAWIESGAACPNA